MANELVTNWHRFLSLKHSSALPYVFTEHGVAMLASVLNSERAVKISIIIVKTFVKLREILATHREFASKLTELEKKLGRHDKSIKALFEAVHGLMVVPKTKTKRIITGFGSGK